MYKRQVVPNTVWLGHAGLKKSNAGIGYSLVSGIVLGAAGLFGLFTFLSNMVPPAVCAVTFLWCAIVMVAQAFKDCEVKHYAAVGIAMVPPVADYLYTQITGAVGLAGYYTEVTSSGLSEYNAEITQMIKDAGVMWNGVPGVKSGAIIIGILDVYKRQMEIVDGIEAYMKKYGFETVADMVGLVD